MRRRHLGVVMVTCVMLSVAACASDDATSDRSEPESDTRLPEAAARLEGPYVHYDEVAYDGEGLGIRIVSYGVTQLEIRDGELWADQEFCHAEQLTDQPIEMMLSDAATQAIVPPPTAVEVRELDDGRLEIVRPPTPTPVGIELDDPANDPWPDDPASARLVDADEDGNPGVTVRIGSPGGFEGELYLARREIFSYELTEIDTGELLGTVTDRSEQLLIDATDPTLLASGDWVQVDDPSESPVRWLPTGALLDCDEVTSRRQELFGTPPPVDW